MSRVLPILFNTDMVRAILDGRKTVTRRLVKTKTKDAYGFYVTFRKSDNTFMGVYDYDENEMMFERPQTPPCQPGDILYVRETWNRCGKGYRYKADWQKDDIADIVEWRPSIHMPKEAARIWLKVTDVRVERLQEIDGKGVLKEGINSHVHPEADYFNGNQKEMFGELWDATIKKTDIGRYGWDANPWVWVIVFERCEKPEGEDDLARKILFRGKRINDGEWVKGYVTRIKHSDNKGKVKSYYFNALNEPGWVAECSVYAETVCQYTGLTDKNGRKIFERDIVKLPKCDNDIAVFVLRGCNYFLKGKRSSYEFGSFDSEYFEVIGNIFDNPELVSVERK